MRNLDALRLNSRESDKRVRLFPFASVFLPPFIELKYDKRRIRLKLHELTTFEALGVTRFKAHARGRKIFSFWFTLGTKYLRSVKFKHMPEEGKYSAFGSH